MTNEFVYNRNQTINFAKQLNEQIADAEAVYFNNTIRWHLGHVLVIAESLLFGYPQNSEALPKQYDGMFKTGTKPSDWQEEPPALSELIRQLEEQKDRVSKLDATFFAKDLDFTLPFGNFKTYGDVFTMIKQHESEHLGKMKAMKQVVEKAV